MHIELVVYLRCMYMESTVRNMSNCHVLFFVFFYCVGGICPYVYDNVTFTYDNGMPIYTNSLVLVKNISKTYFILINLYFYMHKLSMTRLESNFTIISVGGTIFLYMITKFPPQPCKIVAHTLR